MQYVNDDMDELFRRAAENYPLNTNSADWNEVQKKLIAAGIGEQETVVEKKKFNKDFCCCFCSSLPFGSMLILFSNKNNKAVKCLLTKMSHQKMPYQIVMSHQIIMFRQKLSPPKVFHQKVEFTLIHRLLIL